MDFNTLNSWLTKNFGSIVIKDAEYDEDAEVLTFPSKNHRTISEIYNKLKLRAPKSVMTDDGQTITIHIKAYTKLNAKARLLATLTEKQKQLDVNGDGEIDGEDLKRVRNGERGKA